MGWVSPQLSPMLVNALMLKSSRNDSQVIDVTVTWLLVYALSLSLSQGLMQCGAFWVHSRFVLFFFKLAGLYSRSGQPSPNTGSALTQCWVSTNPVIIRKHLSYLSPVQSHFTSSPDSTVSLGHQLQMSYFMSCFECLYVFMGFINSLVISFLWQFTVVCKYHALHFYSHLL